LLLKFRKNAIGTFNARQSKNCLKSIAFLFADLVWVVHFEEIVEVFATLDRCENLLRQIPFFFAELLFPDV